MFLDNLFTSSKLLLALRDRGIGATETARTNSGIILKFVKLKKRDKKADKVPWGTLKRVVTKDHMIIQLVWKDNLIALI